MLQAAATVTLESRRRPGATHSERQQTAQGKEPPKLTAKNTKLLFALRPFSLIVAIATCSLGILLAWSAGPVSVGVSAAVLLAGLLLQAGVNLINDHADIERLSIVGAERRAIERNARIGVAAIALACAIGVWLVTLRGWPLLLLGAVGVLGLWGYASEPINLKSRGLGLPAVFLLTGVLMVCGAYYTVRGAMSVDVIAWSVPFSAFAALLLLANELRDFELDRRDGHATLSARLGHARAAQLYALVAASVALSTVALALAFGRPLVVLAVLPLGLLPLNLLGRPAQERTQLARQTGRCYAAFTAVFLVSLGVSLP
ncbi:MAG: prenyltransferase [Halieaceae bacterium]|jgi:1,4-dihydroxy-2-naphthoate octaprenyltransferase|nr:prenyltransferase [Halieaceae bacterium]